MKTQFNPENKESLTYGECLRSAMEITEQEDADQYFSDYLAFIQNRNPPTMKKSTAEEIAKTNLGYFAGYYSDETRERVEKLFHCSHPIFGSIKDNGAPTAEEAFEKGRKIGEQLRHEHAQR